MILTCPACTMRYLVSEGAIGPAGRRVRCANCGNQWTQEPEQGLDAELFGEAPSFLAGPEPEIDIDFAAGGIPSDPAVSPNDFQEILRKEIEAAPIPQGVRPDQDDPVLNQLLKDKSVKRASMRGERIAGFVTAACVWLAVFGCLLVFQPQVSRAWPPANLLYDLIGLDPVAPGAGLALDNLRAVTSGEGIALRGTIINLTSGPADVPPVLASILDENQKSVDQILIAPPVSRLREEGQVDFEAMFTARPSGASDISFAFSYRAMDAEDPPGTPDSDQAHARPEPSADAAPVHADESADTHASEH